MPLHRFNTKSTSPNPYFNFITTLPSYVNAPNLPSQDDANGLLQALAAQVRPLCKKHGFNVNSFEEYEYNTVFLGRNWNAGETIEIVLRRSDGSFHNIQHLIQVVCHELAHIKHMNHLAGFQQLNAQLYHEVTALRAKGYYGDGMYSSGTRLSDSAEVAGRGLGATDSDLPEYMCGGAQERRRASTLRRTRRQNGPPKKKRRKAGARVTSKYAFVGQGNALNADASGEEEKKRGTGFGKRTQSVKERQARLEAIERRLKNLEKTSEIKPVPDTEFEPEASSDSDSESFEETDEIRRKLLADSGVGWKFSAVCDAGPSMGVGDDIIDLVSDDDEGSSQVKMLPPPKPTPAEKLEPQKRGTSNSLATLVHDEVEYRKREQLGLIGSHRLGNNKQGAHRSRLLDTVKVQQSSKPSNNRLEKRSVSSSMDEWACVVCTCLNHKDYGVCQACSTRRGSSTFTLES
ncbi:DNA damage response protein wss1 OS=Schizosaccharomyces pombe (strain 972 / ATCC 24843) GN=wss1 PE=3 SV=1 [Rhizoctonia solani AG-1 IB]|uniref:DNA damage response protein wss1 n=1 Tax=Thanatephorus cucumeris (strain AG1-IB / isolate 7/3/14) TaxID=1108050 RepID=A0A0B7FH02_THACB|nr:DNA damage response protein wss1 OS=Schizosaccharomyces pombe (strain 972 / ATCC 24843) GN=wss1 PE=3 SV=1 [Rhizoctonia solani AG-1 IB]